MDRYRHFCLIVSFIIGIIAVSLAGCSSQKADVSDNSATKQKVIIENSGDDTSEDSSKNKTQDSGEDATVTGNEAENSCTNATTEVAQENETNEESQRKSIIVVIDPGHQSIRDTETEPLGPGSTELKVKESGGTRGVSTGVYEYQLNLVVSKKLNSELSRRGYSVVMTRSSNDVDLGNIDRAEIANEADADAFIRIHANGASDSKANGAMALCMTSNSPYNAELYKRSRKLADSVLDEFVSATGATKGYVWETDSMTGINWSKVPVIIFEMGFMTNSKEDQRMNTSEYQEKMVKGIANGIDKYFEAK
jgi:N-acetylmuramoyl-L-alanine amidase